MSDTGTFRTTIRIEHPTARGRVAMVADTLVDTRSAMTWIPEEILRSLDIHVEGMMQFITPAGQRVKRPSGYAIVHAAAAETIDEVVFARAGDVIRLGARSLSGLNLKVDERTKQLVPGGPVPAGSA